MVNSKSILIVPSFKKGNGTGHIKRSILLADDWSRNVNILYEENSENRALDNIIDSFPELSKYLIDEKSLKESYDYVLLDRRETSIEIYKKYKDLGAVIGLDEGGKSSTQIPWLIDILPSIENNRYANLTDITLLDLPKNCDYKHKSISSKILITIGGEDYKHLSDKIIKSILELNIVKAGNITLIAGPFATVIDDSSINIIENVQNLKDKLSNYSLVITSYGLTAWESVAAGIPVLLYNPSEYHQKLSMKSNFCSLGYNEIDNDILKDYLLTKKEDWVNPQLPNGSKSLKKIIKQSNYEKQICPNCQSNQGEIIYRDELKSYCHCSNCFMIYLINIKAKIETYSKDYFFSQYKKQYGKSYLEDFEHIKSMGLSRLKYIMRYIKSGNLIDIGSAYGPFLSAAKDNGYSPYGIEICEDAKNWTIEHLSIDVTSKAIGSFDLNDLWGFKKADIVTLWYVIEHFKDLRTVLININRSLRKGGLLAFSTPSIRGISARTSIKNFLRISPNDHYTIMDPGNMNLILKSYGFKVVKKVTASIYPERGKLKIRRKTGLMYRFLLLLNKLFFRGDSFELYAIKERDI